MLTWSVSCSNGPGTMPLVRSPTWLVCWCCTWVKEALLEGAHSLLAGCYRPRARGISAAFYDVTESACATKLFWVLEKFTSRLRTLDRFLGTCWLETINNRVHLLIHSLPQLPTTVWFTAVAKSQWLQTAVEFSQCFQSSPQRWFDLDGCEGPSLCSSSRWASDSLPSVPPRTLARQPFLLLCPSMPWWLRRRVQERRQRVPAAGVMPSLPGSDSRSIIALRNVVLINTASVRRGLQCHFGKKLKQSVFCGRLLLSSTAD